MIYNETQSQKNKIIGPLIPAPGAERVGQVDLCEFHLGLYREILSQKQKRKKKSKTKQKEVSWTAIDKHSPEQNQH